MSVYLLISDEQKGPYSEGQVRAMYTSGSVTSDVHYWREGQAEWLPIETLFPSPIKAEQASPRVSQSTTITKDSKESQKSVARILFIVVGAIGAIILAAFQFHNPVSKDPAPGSLAALKALDDKLQDNLDRMNNDAISERKARQTMTTEQVLKALGTPDSIDPPDPVTSQYVKQTWHYGDDYVAFGWDNQVNAVSDHLDYDKKSQ